MKVQNNISRESYIDVARGLVILLVLIGHSEPPALIKTGIYGFHMPFFFILSGYLFDSNKWCRGDKAISQDALEGVYNTVFYSFLYKSDN